MNDIRQTKYFWASLNCQEFGKVFDDVGVQLNIGQEILSKNIYGDNDTKIAISWKKNTN